MGYMEKNTRTSTLVRWDSQEKIIYIKVLQNIKEQEAKNDTDKVSKIFDQIPENETISILANVSSVGKIWDFSARRVYTELLKKYKGRTIKGAMVGANTLIRLITGFVSTVGGKKISLNFFNSTEEGLRWLKQAKDK